MIKETINMVPSIFCFAATVGIIFALWIVFNAVITLVKGIKAHFMSEIVPLSIKFGSWAVITGSTDGIGKAYALELAKRGINIVLISRNEKKLEAVAEEIRHKHLVPVKTITADFSKGPEVFEKIKLQLQDIPVGILVNNVGKQYKYPMCVGEVEEKELWDILNINIGATTMMTRMVLPQMVQRKKGAIVNVSSGSELQPLPLMTVYAASKTFIQSFSNALRFEYRKSGITVQHLSPMFVNTKMNDFSFRLRETRIFVPDAQTYAKNAVNLLGVSDNSTGYWAHGVQYFITTLSPIWFRTYIGGFMNQIFRNDYYKNLKTLNGKNNGLIGNEKEIE